MNAAVVEDQQTAKLDGAPSAKKTWTATEIESLEWVYKFGTMDRGNGRLLFFYRNKATEIWRVEIKRDGKPVENRYSIGIWPGPNWTDALAVANELNNAAQ